MKKRILSFFCACLLLFTALSSLGTFATEPESEEEPTLKELTDLAKRAYSFASTVQGGWSSTWHVQEGGTYYSSVITEGTIGKNGSELPPYVDRHTGDEYPKDPDTLYGVLPEEVAMESLKKDYFELFYYDLYELFSCCHDHIHYDQPGGYRCFNMYMVEDIDGRVYIMRTESPFMGSFWGEESAEWYDHMEEHAEIISKSDDQIVIRLFPEESWADSNITVEFRKNADGWRVFGGLHTFDNGYGEPPETGDNTPILLTLTALSVFGLVALAVTVGRKKKERL